MYTHVRTCTFTKYAYFFHRLHVETKWRSNTHAQNKRSLMRNGQRNQGNHPRTNDHQDSMIHRTNDTCILGRHYAALIAREAGTLYACQICTRGTPVSVGNGLIEISMRTCSTRAVSSQLRVQETEAGLEDKCRRCESLWRLHALTMPSRLAHELCNLVQNYAS